MQGDHIEISHNSSSLVSQQTRDSCSESRGRNAWAPFRLAAAQIICRTLPPFLGQRIRSYIYPWSTAVKHSLEYMVRCQTGSLYSGNTGDFPSYPMSVHGFNNFWNWAIALAVTEPGDTIIEVGANTGTETVGFSDIVGPSGRVIAFEPLPSNLRRLRKNVQLNGFQNVTVFPLALGQRTCGVNFSVPPDANSGVGHVDVDRNSTDTIHVQMTTLDDLAGVLGACKLLAMDAEGAEALVLRGGRNYIERYEPVIIVEAQPLLLARLGISLLTLRNELTSLGYEPLLISSFGVRKLQPNAKLENCQGDWLCLPAGCGRTHIQSLLLRCTLTPFISNLNPLTRSASRNRLRASKPSTSPFPRGESGAA